MSRKRIIVSLAVNIYLAVSTLVIVLSGLTANRPTDSSFYGFHGTENLVFYTVDSNILMSLCAIVIIILLFMKKDSFPRWFHILTMAAAASVGVTFVTVAFFLAPGQAMAGRGYFSLFTRNNLFLHFLNPVLGCIDFICLIPHRRYSIPECLCGTIPTVVYGVVYIVMVIFLRKWIDIYNFSFGGHFELAPIPMAIILVVSFGIAVLITRLHNRLSLQRDDFG